MSKIINLFVLTSLTIFVMGCYDSITLNSNQINQAMNYKKITVVVDEDDGTIGQYQISKNTCSIVNDTLRGRGAKILSANYLNETYLKVPVSKIKYFEVQETNAGKTLLLTGGIIGGTALLFALLSSGGDKESSAPSQSTWGGTKFSCPLIYTLNDTGYTLESETFAGAVFKGIERSSYDVLYHIKPVEEFYKMKLVNAREETEYVNEFKLIVVDHSAEVSVIPDAVGNIHTISKLIPPQIAVDSKNQDITKIIAREDGYYLENDLQSIDINKDSDLVSSVTATFQKPKNVKTVKIVVSGLNTELAYFALERVFALQGNKKIDWYNKLDSNPKERSKFVGWLMREGMLHLSVWDGEKWDERGIIPDVGPGVQKTQITILNIADIRDDILKVRIFCRTGLWRLDRISADYSIDRTIDINEVSANYATNENGENVSNLISQPDSAYYVTINGEYANISFPVPPEKPGLSRTLIAKTTGFYNQWTQLDEEPRLEVVTRILTEPLFSSKYLIPLWLTRNNKQQDVVTIEN